MSERALICGIGECECCVRVTRERVPVRGDLEERRPVNRGRQAPEFGVVPGKIGPDRDGVCCPVGFERDAGVGEREAKQLGRLEEEPDVGPFGGYMLPEVLVSGSGEWCGHGVLLLVRDHF